MAQEIERKFLLKDDRWRAQVSRTATMRQGYLASDASCSIRVRVTGDAGYLNIKSATLGVARSEFEYAIPVTEARELLDLFCRGRCLDKVRHYISRPPHIWEIDVFEGDNAGLVVAEIELTSVAESFACPEWLGPEVSADPRYYNVCLIDHPYSAWPAASRD